MTLAKEQEQICRELENPSELALSLANQALILVQNLNQPREALPRAKEAYDLALQHGLTALAEQIRSILDLVRSTLRQG